MLCQQTMAFFADFLDFVVLLLQQFLHHLRALPDHAAVQEDGEDPAQEARDGQQDTQEDQRRLADHGKGGPGHESGARQAQRDGAGTGPGGFGLLQLIQLPDTGFKVPLQAGQLHFVDDFPVALEQQLSLAAQSLFRRSVIQHPAEVLIAVQLQRRMAAAGRQLQVFISHIGLSVLVNLTHGIPLPFVPDPPDAGAAVR